MMVVKNNGEVATHYNANNLLKVAEETESGASAFGWVTTWHHSNMFPW